MSIPTEASAPMFGSHVKQSSRLSAIQENFFKFCPKLIANIPSLFTPVWLVLKRVSLGWSVPLMGLRILKSFCRSSPLLFPSVIPLLQWPSSRCVIPFPVTTRRTPQPSGAPQEQLPAFLTEGGWGLALLYFLHLTLLLSFFLLLFLTSSSLTSFFPLPLLSPLLPPLLLFSPLFLSPSLPSSSSSTPLLFHPFFVFVCLFFYLPSPPPSHTATPFIWVDQIPTIFPRP